MIIESTTVDQEHGGGITASAGGIVRLEGDHIIGGYLYGTSHVDVIGLGNEIDGGPFGIDLNGLIRVLNGGNVTLAGSIQNYGKIDLLAGTKTADLIVGTTGATLASKGDVVLGDSANNRIYGKAAGDVLTNADDRIEGAGQLGKGVLTLVNQAAGVIDGSQALALTIDTGTATIQNAGLIENVGKGGTLINSAVDNTGTLEEIANGTLSIMGAVTGSGRAVVKGGTLFVSLAFGEAVTFSGSNGTLRLGQSQAFTGKITGFAGTNALDLADVTFTSGVTKATFSGTAAGGVLTVTDGTHTAHIALVGDYRASTFNLSSDGHGGTKVVDPPAPAGPALSQAMAALVAISRHFPTGWRDRRMGESDPRRAASIPLKPSRRPSGRLLKLPQPSAHHLQHGREVLAAVAQLVEQSEKRFRLGPHGRGRPGAGRGGLGELEVLEHQRGEEPPS